MTSEIINDLKGENNQSFGVLYKEYFGMVNRFVTNNKGHTTDAEDLFQDTMIVLLGKLRQDNFVLSASIKTYIMAIAKNLWMKRLRDGKHHLEYAEKYDNIFYEDINKSIEAEKNYWDKLHNYMHQITKHCEGLIHNIFFRKKSIEQIQSEYGYSTKHNAQNQKHKCIEQIRKVKNQDEELKA